MPQRMLNAALLSLFVCLLLLPNTLRAAPCQPSKDCICPGGPNSNFCILQLRLNNPKYVHMKLLGDWELANVRQGNWQFEARPGEQIYVNRSNDGLTSFGIQFCQKTLLSSDCSSWATMTLQESSQKQFAACEKYADKAVAAAKQNISNNCGFPSDGRFSKDHDWHRNWCVNLADADRHFMTDETNARQQGLNDCQAKIAANAAEVAKNFTGNWSVSMQPVGDFTLVLRQQGPAISGQMVNADPTKNGTIQGSLESDNQHVSFSYVQPQINAGGQGRFWMELTKDKLGGRFSINGEQAVRLLDGTRK